MLYWYSLTAPVEPPDPPEAVTVPELYPAHTMVLLAGEATLSTGAVGVDATVQVQIVLQAELLQP